MEDPIKPTTATDRPNLSVLHQKEGDGRRPSEHLDKDQPQGEETVPRKSKLIE